MIQPGMMFGGEGPIMQGTWYNPHTGDAFTVRDSFFEDNQYVVTTTDGRYLRYDQLQQYIQSDMKLEDLKRAHLDKQNKQNTHEILPKEVSNLISTDEDDLYFGSNLMIPEDNDLLSKPLTTPKIGNINEPAYSQSNQRAAQPATTNMNKTIIEKALKNTTNPFFTLKLDWDNYPAKQIEMLKDIMEIPTDEIIEWYLDNINMIDFIEEFKKSIKDRIDNETTDNAVCFLIDEVTVPEILPEIPTKQGIDVKDPMNVEDTIIPVATPAKKTSKRTTKSTNKKH